MFTGLNFSDLMTQYTSLLTSDIISGLIAAIGGLGLLGFALSIFFGIWKRRD